MQLRIMVNFLYIYENYTWLRVGIIAIVKLHNLARDLVRFTAIGVTYPHPLVSSISVQTCTSDTDISILPVMEKSCSTNRSYLVKKIL